MLLTRASSRLFLRLLILSTPTKLLHRSKSYLAPPFLLDTYTPRYQLLKPHQASLKRSAAYAHLSACNLCPRLCDVDRLSSHGTRLVRADVVIGGGRNKLQKKSRPESSGSDATTTNDATAAKHSFMTLPMFSYLDETRDFTIPFDIYVVKEGRREAQGLVQDQQESAGRRSEAKKLWEKLDKLPASTCVCQAPAPGEQECEDDYLNRVMQNECNDDNCNLPAA
ncbi:hypothetical protein LTS00_017605 [Friedmanniomyces endolithicus]|nr:hypothetical protein LTS00_017605 [Friedmanniomyces endolithicus]